jgi:hypothetical protein
MTFRGLAIATGAVLLGLILLGFSMVAFGDEKSSVDDAARFLGAGLLFAGGLWALVWGVLIAVHHWIPGARERRDADRMLEARRRERHE